MSLDPVSVLFNFCLNFFELERVFCVDSNIKSNRKTQSDDLAALGRSHSHSLAPKVTVRPSHSPQ